MVWTVANPGVGDVASLRRIASQSDTAITDVQSALTTLGTVVADLPSSWAGAAADQHLATISGVVPELQQLQQSYTDHRDAITAYAASVESIQTAANALISQIDELETDLTSYNTRRYNSNVPVPSPLVAPEVDPLFDLRQDPWDESDLIVARTLDADIKQTQQDLFRASSQLSQLANERATADSTCVAALSATQVPNDLTSTERDAVDAVSGEDLAAYLLTLTQAQRSALLLNDPSIVERLKAAGPDNAADVAALWVSLGAATALLLALKYPEIVGNLEGALYDSRDVANTKVLDRDLTSLQAKLDGLKPGAEYDKVSKQLEALKQLDLALGDRRGEEPPRFLISLEYPDGLVSDKQPLAAVALGNLDTADNTTYVVPGMNTNLADSAVNMRNDGLDLYRTQGEILADSGSDESRAVVAWIGYETPSPLTVALRALAYTGADKLGAALDGFNAVRDATGSDAHLGVVAHSYGSTTAMLTLEENHGVDSFVVFGSAGQIPNTTIDMPKEDFYYTMGPADDLALIGQITGDRWDPAFYNWGNITVMDSGTVEFTDENGNRVEFEPARGFMGHTGYLDLGTSSQYNIAAAGLGADDMIVDNSTVRG